MSDVITGIYPSGQYSQNNGRPVVGYPAIHSTGNLQTFQEERGSVNEIFVSGYEGQVTNNYLDTRLDDRTYYT